MYRSFILLNWCSKHAGVKASASSAPMLSTSDFDAFAEGDVAPVSDDADEEDDQSDEEEEDDDVGLEDFS